MEWEDLKLEVENVIGNRLDKLQSGLEFQRGRIVDTISKIQSFAEILKKQTFNGTIEESKLSPRAQTARTHHKTQTFQKPLALETKKSLKKEDEKKRPESAEKNRKIEEEKVKKDEAKAKIEEQKKKKAEEEDAKKKKAEEAKKKKEEEESKKKEAQLKKKEEEDNKKKEALQKKKDEEERKKEETKRKAEEAKEKKKAEDNEKKIKAEETKKKLDEEKEKKKLEEAEKKQKAEEAKKKVEEKKKSELKKKPDEKPLAKDEEKKIEESKKSAFEIKKKPESSKPVVSEKASKSASSKSSESQTPKEIEVPKPTSNPSSIEESKSSKPSESILAPENLVSNPPQISPAVLEEIKSIGSLPAPKGKHSQLRPSASIDLPQLSLEEIQIQLQSLKANHTEEELKTEKPFELSVGAKSALSILVTMDSEKFFLNQVPKTEVIWVFRLFFLMLNKDLPESDEDAWAECQKFLISAMDTETNRKTIDKHIIDVISGFDFSEENIDTLERLVFEKDELLQPQHYTDFCALAGLLMFAIREAALFCGAIKGKIPIWRQYKRLLHKQSLLENLMLS